MGGAESILSLVLTALAIVAAVLKGVQLMFTNELVKQGLIRPQRRRGETQEENWPNDFHSLPETLAGLYVKIQILDDKFDKHSA